MDSDTLALCTESSASVADELDKELLEITELQGRAARVLSGKGT